jgi:hypothetical protein
MDGFQASDMVLHVDSDGSHLSAPKSRSRGAGYFYLSSFPMADAKESDPMPPHNGAVLVPCQIMREVLSSAAETELSSLYPNCKEACAIRTTLDELARHHNCH